MAKLIDERPQPQPNAPAESWARADSLTALSELLGQAGTVSRAAWADERSAPHYRRSPIFVMWRVLQDQLQELQARIVAEFATERGWHRAQRVFTLVQLSAGRPGRSFPYEYAERASGASSVLDHGDYFREPHRPYRPTAVVTHLYADNDTACHAFAEQAGLRFERLPWSWHNPDRCLAGVFTRDPSDSALPRTRRRPRLRQVKGAGP
jgi:hypothetical protein